MLANPMNLWFIDTDLNAASGYGYGTNMRPRNHIVPLVEPQLHVIDAANPGGAFDNRIEHRLDVPWANG